MRYETSAFAVQPARSQQPLVPSASDRHCIQQQWHAQMLRCLRVRGAAGAGCCCCLLLLLLRLLLLLAAAAAAAAAAATGYRHVAVRLRI